MPYHGIQGVNPLSPYLQLKQNIMALSAATQEALYLKKLVSQFDQNLSEHCITIHEDNQGATALVDNPVHHNRTKHIDIRYHFTREQVQCNCIKIVYLQTNLMIADCLTKPVGRNTLDFCKNVLLGCKNIQPI